MSDAIITALGAVTSVGFDAVTACASIRAGLSRPDSIAEFEVLDREDQAPIGVTGHPVPLLTRGFSGVGRWLQMAAVAIEDLCSSGKLPGADDTAFWSSTFGYVVVPVIDAQRFVATEACQSDQAIEASFLHPLRRRVSSLFAPSKTVLLTRGRGGVLEAMALAQEHFRQHRFERVVVLAVDSLTDPPGLNWLSEMGRLKEDENPVGLVPGEAAVAFMLEMPRVAQTRGAQPLGRLASVAVGREPHSRWRGERSQGVQLASVVKRALTEARCPLPYTAETSTDLNGEAWRSEEYGHAQVRVSQARWSSDSAGLPAACVGDLGTAMSAMQVVMACRAHIRGYAQADPILFTSSDVYGNVGAAMIGKAS
ncbi:MAG: hypothetical protein K0V04_24790 [Deltaproteobacteria bacterium]|nr:hypothetical protein [Deltaproteobacteria bacterium]